MKSIIDRSGYRYRSRGYYLYLYACLIILMYMAGQCYCQKNQHKNVTGPNTNNQRKRANSNAQSQARVKIFKNIRKVAQEQAPNQQANQDQTSQEAENIDTQEKQQQTQVQNEQQDKDTEQEQRKSKNLINKRKRKPKVSKQSRNRVSRKQSGLQSQNQFEQQSSNQIQYKQRPKSQSNMEAETQKNEDSKEQDNNTDQDSNNEDSGDSVDSGLEIQEQDGEDQGQDTQEESQGEKNQDQDGDGGELDQFDQQPQQRRKQEQGQGNINQQQQTNSQSNQQQIQQSDSYQSLQQQSQGQGQQQQKLQIPSKDSEQIKKSFKKYRQKYGVQYPSEDQIIFRFVIYSDNAKKTIDHNADRNKTYRIHINQYADQTIQEFQSKHLMKNLANNPSVYGPALALPDKFDIIPIDWRQKNATTALRKQGECGSCWAFSVTGIIQSHLFIRKAKPLQRLSVQQLVDCCQAAGFTCFGCQGSWPGNGMKYVAVQGLATQKDYPYIQKADQCKKDVTTRMYLNKDTPFKSVKGPKQLAFALLSGPISATVDSSLWQPLYDEGIFNECTDEIDYNHAVIVVGVSADGVWIVRNSWGRFWGESGHIRLPAGNSCGISDWGVLPILSD